MMRLVDALDLPDDKALALRAIFRKADERRVELVAKRQAIDKELRAALSRPDKDQAQLAKLVEEASTVDRDLASVAEDSFRDAQKDLTVEQQAKLVLLRRELQGQVREAVRRRLGQQPPLNFFVTGEWMASRHDAPIAPQTTVRFGLTIAFPQFSPW